MYKVYGGNGCAACESAKNELSKRGKEFQYFDVYTNMEALEYITSKGLRSIPQIFTDTGEHIGGYQDLVKHLNK